MNQSQPTTSITKTDRIIDIITIAGIVLNVALAVGYFSQLPDTIAVHFNAKGEPNGYGGKYMIFLLPVISMVLFVTMSRVMKAPATINYPFSITEENAERQHRNAAMMIRTIRLLVVALFGYLTWATIQIGIGNAQGLGVWSLPVMLSVLFVVIGGFLIRAFRLR